MPKKLDRERGFGEVMGHESGAKYEQDGVMFDVDGVELFDEGAPAKAKASAKASAKAKAPAKTEPVAAPDQVSAQLEGGEGGLES